VALLIGGVSFSDQDMKITRGVDVLICTPGRLLDHFERGKLLLTGVELLVIDEADRMLDMGFIPDIERIVKLVPFTRQTLFFSATMPPEIQRLADAFLHNPVKVEVGAPASTAATISQRLVAAGREAHEKRDRLRRLIRGEPELKNAIIFCNRKRDVAVLYRSLQQHGFNADRAAWRPRPARPHGGARQFPLRRGDVSRRERRRRPAGSTSRRSATSSISTFRTTPRTMSTASGAPGRAGRLGTAVTLVTPGDENPSPPSSG
jgi:superfamily II DNA/RNA helicase